jgi:excisionase family DNA binding protein
MKTTTVTQRGYSIHETAEASGLSKPTVRRLIASGELRTYRVGTAVRIVAADVHQLTAPGSTASTKASQHGRGAAR